MSSTFSEIAPAELESVEGGFTALLIVAAFAAGFAAGYVAGHQDGAASAAK